MPVWFFQWKLDPKNSIIRCIWISNTHFTDPYCNLKHFLSLYKHIYIFEICQKKIFHRCRQLRSEAAKLQRNFQSSNRATLRVDLQAGSPVSSMIPLTSLSKLKSKDQIIHSGWFSMPCLCCLVIVWNHKKMFGFQTICNYLIFKLMCQKTEQKFGF